MTTINPRRLIFFINPISGTRNKDVVLEKIKQRCTAAQIPFEILSTRKDADYHFLEEMIMQQKITDVIICGGDGSINQVSAFIGHLDVNVGIIPLGSGNGLAFTAGIPSNADKALDIILAGNANYIDGFYINNQFSCMLCGLGFDAQVAQDFAAEAKRGLLTYVKQTIKNFITAKTYPFVLHIHDTQIQTDAFFISVANSNQFGNNVTIAPKASISDGLLDIVVVNKMSKMRLLYAVLRQLKFGEITQISRYHKKAIFYFQAKKLSIDNPRMAPLHIDGDPASTANRFEIQIKEKAFRLLQS